MGAEAIIVEEIHVEWDWIDLSVDDKWSDSRDKLVDAGARVDDLSRSVYVIRISETYAIQYPKDPSPTLYIGEGSLPGRRDAHRKWLSDLMEEFGELPIELGVSKFRVPNNPDAYKDLEARLLWFFDERYGSLPLQNSIYETPASNYSYRESDLTTGVGLGRGIIYKWAIMPMARSRFSATFLRTYD